VESEASSADSVRGEDAEQLAMKATTRGIPQVAAVEATVPNRRGFIA
jgi:hypothetical protein